MPIIINLFLSAIRPITFFIPCAAIILGCGLAAFQGIVDGALFSSLLILTVLAQVTFNLVNDYQRAFVTHTNSAIAPSTNPILYKARKQMLQLILGCFLIFTFALGLLSFAAIGGSSITLAIIAATSFIFLLILRVKTRKANPLNGSLNPIELILHILLYGLFPVSISYYLLTSSLPINIAFIALNTGLLASMHLLSENINQQININAPVNSDNMPAAISRLLMQQKVLLIAAALLSLGYIYFILVPLTSVLFFLALPSLYATIVTIQHYPEEDVATSQSSKTAIAIFAYWVLFVIGLML